MKKGNLTPKKTAKQRKRRRAYERQRNILHNRPKQNFRPEKKRPRFEMPAKAKVSLWSKIKNWWYNKIKKQHYVKEK